MTAGARAPLASLSMTLASLIISSDSFPRASSRERRRPTIGISLHGLPPTRMSAAVPSSVVHLVVGELGRCDSGNPISICRSHSPVRTLAPSLPQPLIPLPPPLRLTPCSLLLRRHPLGDIAPRQRQQRLRQPEPELDPEGGPLRHEKRPGAEAKEHYRNRNALLLAHAQTNFLLGMAQTRTGVMRATMMAIVSGAATASQITAQCKLHRSCDLYSAWRTIP